MHLIRLHGEISRTGRRQYEEGQSDECGVMNSSKTDTYIQRPITKNGSKYCQMYAFQFHDHSYTGDFSTTNFSFGQLKPTSF